MWFIKPSNLWVAAAVVVSICAVPTLARAEQLRLASWNLNNLHYETGVPLRSRAPVRSEKDYTLLNAYRRELNAAVIAFQEVNGPRAAHRVFPDDQYQVFVSGRHSADLTANRSTDRIYTGFAVRRGSVDVVRQVDVPELSVSTDVGQATRWGTEIVLSRNGRELRLLSVHLKSGCFTGSLTRPRKDACVTLAAQRDPLDAWVDQAFLEGTPFIILGDFNRAFEVHGDRDHLWQALDDAEPSGLDLWRLPFNRDSECWRGTKHHHPNPIDHFVFDDQAWRMVKRGSFKELTYKPEHLDRATKTPSDHCPIVVEIDF